MELTAIQQFIQFKGNPISKWSSAQWWDPITPRPSLVVGSLDASLVLGAPHLRLTLPPSSADWKSKVTHSLRRFGSRSCAGRCVMALRPRSSWRRSTQPERSPTSVSSLSRLHTEQSLLRTTATLITIHRQSKSVRIERILNNSSKNNN